ncbi:MAG: GNAT family N-acetyltransferase [Bacteroidetes bacterium]|nr:GNAT family N-acetyltransferase [Bacteroidota bacterium]MBL0065118.1 GNAT family N-acetyltransferase [Bacteroidota bacterium]
MIEIREATIHDIDQIAFLFDQYRIFYKKASDPEGAKKFISDRFNKKESVIFIAVDTIQIIGFVQLYPLFSSTRMKRLWLLNDLFVSSEHRGLGYSVQLIEKCKSFCLETGACGLILETAIDNAIGNNLYPGTGFTLDKEFNRYYWDV